MSTTQTNPRPNNPIHSLDMLNLKDVLKVIKLAVKRYPTFAEEISKHIELLQEAHHQPIHAFYRGIFLQFCKAFDDEEKSRCRRFKRDLIRTHASGRKCNDLISDLIHEIEESVDESTRYYKIECALETLMTFRALLEGKKEELGHDRKFEDTIGWLSALIEETTLIMSKIAVAKIMENDIVDEDSLHVCWTSLGRKDISDTISSF